MGTGYTGTRAGAVAATRRLSDIFPASSSASAPPSVRLVLVGTDLLAIATPDPATGTGSALRRVDRETLGDAGAVGAPFHGGSLLDDASSEPAGAARSAVDALLSDDVLAPRAPAAPAAFAVFSGADGTVYTLARAPGVSADDRAFGRVPASRYLATSGAAAAASSSKSAPSPASKSAPAALPEAPAAVEAKKKADAPAAAAAIPGRKIAKAKRTTAAAATAAAEPPAPAPAAAADKAVAGAALLYPDGVAAELARPHGATKCILRAYSLSGGGSGASAVADAGGVSALAPLRLKSESAKTLWVPPVAADCQLGAVALPDWAAAPPAGVRVHGAAATAATWLPAISREDAPAAPLRAVVSNGGTTVALTVAGDAFYCGDGKVRRTAREQREGCRFRQATRVPSLPGPRRPRCCQLDALRGAEWHRAGALAAPGSCAVAISCGTTPPPRRSPSHPRATTRSL